MKNTDSPKTEPFSPKRLSEQLGRDWIVEAWPHQHIGISPLIALIAEEIDSTQDRLDEGLLRALPSTTQAVLLATRRQTAGHGREGRSWFSPGDSALAFSIAVRIKKERPPGHWPLLVGWAKARALSSWVNLDLLDLKWPNDLLLKGKKISGSLCSLHHIDGSSWLRVGIGMNIGPMNFPPELNNLATTLAEHTSAPSREQVLGSLVETLLEDLHQLEADDLLKNYSAKCSIANHAMISWIEGGTQHQGVSRGLDQDGALLCEVNGNLRPLHVSEIQHLRPEEA